MLYSRSPSNATEDAALLRWNIVESISGKAVKLFESSNFYKLLTIVIGLIGIPAAIIGAWQPLSDYLNRSARAEAERAALIDGARRELQWPVGGDTGKGKALTTLFENGEALTGLQLSCLRIGQTDDKKQCVSAPIFSNVRLFGSEKNSSIVGIDLRETEFSGLEMNNMYLEGDFRKAQFHKANITNSAIYGMLEGTVIQFSAIVRSQITINDGLTSEGNMTLMDVDLSGTTITPGLSPEWVGLATAWADQPPLHWIVPILTKGEAYKAPLPAAVLERMVLCEPPRSNDGQIIPAEVRDRAVLPLPQIGTFPGKPSNCRRITLNEAMRQFPDVYASMGSPQ